MSDEPLETAPNVPPDWRDWINKVPTVKSLAVFCIISWMLTPLGMIVASWIIGAGYITEQKAIDAILSMIDKWLDALKWATLAAVFGVVGKFATTKPEVIRAEGEVNAKAIVATAQAAAIAPIAPPSSEAAILAEEERARLEKHALNPPIIED
jgi:hypothetical protein